MKSRLTVEDYFNGIISGDRRVLGKAITLTESDLETDRLIAESLIQKIMPLSGGSFRIGITGMPGAGKSTFIQSLGKLVTQSEKKLAVLAIDPSSDISGGSILADKTRMEDLTQDKNVFIRPTPSGTRLGGVSRSTANAIILCEAAGYDYVLVETVGVGQSETLIQYVTDFTILLLIAGAGDELQAIKKGIMEIADLLVVNKADGDNIACVAQTVAELENALPLLPTAASGYKPQVIPSSSLTGDGIMDIWDMLRKYHAEAIKNGTLKTNRLQQNRQLLRQNIDMLLTERFYKNEAMISRLSEIEKQTDGSFMNPMTAAKALVQEFFRIGPENSK